MKNTPSLTLNITTPDGLELATLELDAPTTKARPDMPATMFDAPRFEHLLHQAVQAFADAYDNALQQTQPKTT